MLFNNLGVTLWALEEYDDAMGFYRKALALNPNHVDALANLGVGLWRADDLDAAEDHFSKALALRPNDAVFQKNLQDIRDARQKKPH